MKHYAQPWTRMNSLAQSKLWKMDMRFGTGYVRSLYRPSSLKTVAMELEKHNLDLVGIQVTWEREALNGQSITHSSMEPGMKVIS
jgi:hypothetical protein